MANEILLDHASANQTSAVADSFSRGAVFMQAVVSGGTLTAGNLVSQSSIDGVHWDATNPVFSLAYAALNASTIASATTGVPAMKFVITNMAFTYGKTANAGVGTNDLTIAGTYTPLKA